MVRSHAGVTLLLGIIVLVALASTLGKVHAAGLAIDGQAGSSQCAPSCSVSLSTSNANDIILVLAGGGGGESPVNFGTPTASGLTFSTRKTFNLQGLSGGFTGVGEWWAVACSPLSSKTITLTESSGAAYAMIAYGISGANTTNPFDPDIVLPATAGSISATSSSSVVISTSNPNDAIFGVVGGGPQVGGSSAGTSGFTIWSVSPPYWMAAEYDILSNAQTNLNVVINFGGGATTIWAMIGDAVQAATTTTTVTCLSLFPNQDMLFLLSIGIGALAIVVGALYYGGRLGKRQANEKSVRTTEAEAVAQPTKPKIEPNKQFCIECGSELPSASKFCNKCGSKQSLV